VIPGPGGASASSLSAVVPRIERPAVTRVATALAVKSTITSGVGSDRASAPPDVIVDFTANAVATRVTAGRSILGTTADKDDADAPPGPGITLNTPGVLPFFVTLQRQIPGTFSADVTVAYTGDELIAASVVGDLEKTLSLARFVPGTCTTGGATCAEDGDCGANGPCVGPHYVPVANSTVDTQAHAVTGHGVTDFGVFAVMTTETFAVELGGGGPARTDCRASYRVLDPSGGTKVTKHKKTTTVPTCHDGDPSCDADGAADGTCTFRMQLCFDVGFAGGSDTCTTPPLTGYSFTTKSKRKEIDQQNVTSLVQALVDFGGRRTSPKKAAVRFKPANVDGGCTALTAFRVPTLPGTATLVGKARGKRGVIDADRLQLSCLAPAG